MENIKISGIKEWYLVLLLIISLFNLFVLIQPYSYNYTYLYDNSYNESINHTLNTINQNCGSTHISNGEEGYYVFKTIIKNNKEYYCNIPVDVCLSGDNWKEKDYCRTY